jgi:hypothetical protein
MCILTQKKALLPFLLISILIPCDQVLVVAGRHFPMLRILILRSDPHFIYIALGAKAQYFATSLERDGRVRATASFLAGAFGALSLPLFIGVGLSDTCVSGAYQSGK